MIHPRFHSALICFLLFSWGICVAQAQEVQVPVDREGKISRIDKELEKKLGLFTEYPDFVEARLYQVSDSTFVLEVVQKPMHGLVKDRVEMTGQEAQSFRSQVSDRIVTKAPTARLDQSGRARLLIWSSLLSLGYYGWAVPVIADVDDAKVAVGLYMVTAGAGFFFPFQISKYSEVTDGMGILATHGMTRGIVHGVGFAHLLGGEDPKSESVIAAGMLGSVAEGYAFARLAKLWKLSSGSAEIIGIGDDFGIGWGLCAAAIADATDDDKDRETFALILAGAGTGLVAGKLLADSQPYSRGDAWVVRAGGILGAYLPLALASAFDPDEDDAYVAAAMAGSVVGIGVGHRMIRDREFTTGQGILITLGEIAGAALGMGVAFLVTDDSEDDETVYLSMSAAGAAAGFYGIYRSFSEKALVQQQESSYGFRFGPGVRIDGSTGKDSRLGNLNRPDPQVYFGASLSF